MISNFFGHLSTVLRHKYQVFVHCCKAGIPFRGIVHDLSKFSPAEFIPGVRYYTGDHSPNVGEREEYGYSKAWMHHKGRNRHHFEYWTDYNIKTRRVEPMPMPPIFVAEMFCDRVAASKIYKGKEYTNASPYEYYEAGIAKKQLHPTTAAQLEKLLTVLRDEGEEKAFELCRKELLSKRRKA